MSRFGRLTAKVILIISVMLYAVLPAIAEESFARRFSEIQQAYRERVVQLHVQDATQQHLRDELKRRDKSLRSLLDEACKMDVLALPFDELVAIVDCAQPIREFHRSLPFAQRAFELRSDEVSAQITLIRTLVNSGEIDEAARIAGIVTKGAAPESPIRAAYGLLYLGEKKRHNYRRALECFDEYMRLIVGRVATVPGEGHRFDTYLRRCAELCEIMEGKATFDQHVLAYDAALEDAQKRMTDLDIRTLDSRRQSVSICSARFRIARALANNDRASVAMRAWLRELGKLVGELNVPADDACVELAAARDAMAESQDLLSTNKLIAEEASNIKIVAEAVDSKGRQRIVSRLKELQAVANSLSDLPSTQE